MNTATASSIALPTLRPYKADPAKTIWQSKPVPEVEPLRPLYLSPSSVKSYLTCPLNYYYDRVVGLRERHRRLSTSSTSSRPRLRRSYASAASLRTRSVSAGSWTCTRSPTRVSLTSAFIHSRGCSARGARSARNAPAGAGNAPSEARVHVWLFFCSSSCPLYRVRSLMGLHFTARMLALSATRLQSPYSAQQAAE